MNLQPDIIVVGGGHAGAEAALIAARMGVSTLLVTGLKSAIARMPCNPSIGGLAKSHLVFELDVLGGEMGFNADLTSLQEKTLNTSRGPAVQATRAQCDKAEYTARMQKILATQVNLNILEDAVVGIVTNAAHSQIVGIQTENNGIISTQKIILTTGTTLRGRIFIGKESLSSGGDGRPAVDLLSNSLKSLGFNLIRLKTGTPPRIKASTIDFSKTTPHPGEHNPRFFSLRTHTLISNCTANSVSTWKQPHDNQPSIPSSPKKKKRKATSCFHVETRTHSDNGGIQQFHPNQSLSKATPSKRRFHVETNRFFPFIDPEGRFPHDPCFHVETTDLCAMGNKFHSPSLLGESHDRKNPRDHPPPPLRECPLWRFNCWNRRSVLSLN